MKRLWAIISVIFILGAVFLNTALASPTETLGLVDWLGEEYVDIVPLQTYSAAEIEMNKYVYGGVDMFYQYTSRPRFDSGLAALVKKVEYKDVENVFIDTEGKEVDLGQAFITRPFRNGTAIIQTKEGKTRVIDNKGEEIFNLANRNVSGYEYYSDGLMGLDPWINRGFYDEKGTLALKLDDSFLWVGDFAEGLAPVILKENRIAAYIDKTGKISIKTQYNIGDNFSEGLAVVRKAADNGKIPSSRYGYIDMAGQRVIDTKYVYASSFKNGFASVQREEESDWEMIDTTGATVFSKRCGFMGENNEGLVPVRINGKYGYLDMHGNVVVKPQFDKATMFNEGFALVVKDSRVGIIDRNKVVTLGVDQPDGSDTAMWIMAAVAFLGLIAMLVFENKRKKA